VNKLQLQLQEQNTSTASQTLKKMSGSFVLNSSNVLCNAVLNIVT